FFSSRRRHTRFSRDWSSDVCSSDLNHIAKSLVNRETRTIGLVLTSITNPILTLVAQAIELRLAGQGYSTLFATSNGDHHEEKREIGRASCRERVWIAAVAGSVKEEN